MYEEYNKEHLERYYIAKYFQEDYSNNFIGYRYSISYVDVFRYIDTGTYITVTSQANNLSCNDIDDTKNSFENRNDVEIVCLKEFIDYADCEMYINSILPLNKDIYRSLDFLHDENIQVIEIMHEIRKFLKNGDYYCCYMEREKFDLFPKIQREVKKEFNGKAELKLIDDFTMKLYVCK
ncbi:hypothetical protein [Mammaliicoccus sp. E-M24]|uniref:hypothetical protein n=1 Tax=Mammaliicoccus sp. E-M24 TaxID=2898684 RepID=UPI001EFB5611|nr:hypothetical protein [Mammaliicoccus sp. E-M24]